MFLYLEKNSKAKNKYLTSHDPTKPTKCMTYFYKNDFSNRQIQLLDLAEFNVDKYDDI